MDGPLARLAVVGTAHRPAVDGRHYTTLCQRAKRLGVSLGRKAAGPLHLVLDSTGLKVFGEGEWKVRQHGYTKRRTWRKLHLSVDSKSWTVKPRRSRPWY